MDNLYRLCNDTNYKQLWFEAERIILEADDCLADLVQIIGQLNQILIQSNNELKVLSGVAIFAFVILRNCNQIELFEELEIILLHCYSSDSKLCRKCCFGCIDLISNNCNEEDKLFWNSFLEISNVLDEKQFHIIKPHLPRLNRFFEKGIAWDKNKWCFAILASGLNHMNGLVKLYSADVSRGFCISVLKTVDSSYELEPLNNFILNNLFALLDQTDFLHRNIQQQHGSIDTLVSLWQPLFRLCLLQNATFFTSLINSECLESKIGLNGFFILTEILTVVLEMDNIRQQNSWQLIKAKLRFLYWRFANLQIIPIRRLIEKRVAVILFHLVDFSHFASVLQLLMILPDFLLYDRDVIVLVTNVISLVETEKIDNLVSDIANNGDIDKNTVVKKMWLYSLSKGRTAINNFSDSRLFLLATIQLRIAKGTVLPQKLLNLSLGLLEKLSKMSPCKLCGLNLVDNLMVDFFKEVQKSLDLELVDKLDSCFVKLSKSCATDMPKSTICDDVLLKWIIDCLPFNNNDVTEEVINNLLSKYGHLLTSDLLSCASIDNSAIHLFCLAIQLSPSFAVGQDAVGTICDRFDDVTDIKLLRLLFETCSTLQRKFGWISETGMVLKRSIIIIQEHRGSEGFIGFILFWIRTMLTVELYANANCDNWLVLSQIGSVLKQESFGNPAVAHGFANQISKVLSDAFRISIHSELFWTEIVKIVSNLCLFGPSWNRKDQQLFDKFLFHSRHRTHNFSAPILPSMEEIRYARVYGIVQLHLILSKSSNAELNDVIINTVVSDFIDQYTNCVLLNQKYFEKSQAHFLRTRICQIMLIMLPFVKDQKLLFTFAMNQLICEGHQPSVRLMLEWLVILILVFDCNSISASQMVVDFWNMESKMADTRVGSLCSWLAIGMHFGMATKNVDFITKFLRKILPWCTTQNFVVRVTAIATLKKLWMFIVEQSLKSDQFSAICTKFEVVQEIVNFVGENRNASKQILKLLDEFYYCVFEPIKHYSFETIFAHFPRLTGIIDSSCYLPLCIFENTNISPDQFSRSNLDDVSNDVVISLNNSDNLLDNAKCEIFGGSVGNSDEEDEKLTPSGENENYQKKFVSDLMNEIMMIHSDSDTGHIDEAVDNDPCLIVCASLVDKPTNLGGICRTCEVFGLKELIISDERLLNDHEFKSLSVSSQRWMTITEVKSGNLKEFLHGKSKEGYTIIGAEQTSVSTELSDFKFPEKSLLVLGHEKHGISIDLIACLDLCIEIPQFGITRSLNVHVSASLIIWEWVNQKKV